MEPTNLPSRSMIKQNNGKIEVIWSLSFSLYLAPSLSLSIGRFVLSC